MVSKTMGKWRHLRKNLELMLENVLAVCDMRSDET